MILKVGRMTILLGQRLHLDHPQHQETVWDICRMRL